MTVRLGDTAPDFSVDSTTGTINFHDWIGDSWVFSSATRPTLLRYAPQKWAAPPSWRSSLPHAT